MLKIDSEEEFKKQWIDILNTKFEEFIQKNQNKPIIFTGILDNFGPSDGSIYELKKTTHRFFFERTTSVTLTEILYENM